MFSHYKKLLFSPVFYIGSPEGGALEQENSSEKEEKTPEVLSQDKLTPEAKEELQNITERNEAEIATIQAQTKEELGELKKSLENTSALETEVSNLISNIELKNDATLKVEDGQVKVFSKDGIQVRYFTIENWKEEETFITDGKYDQEKIQDWANLRVDQYLQKISEKNTDSKQTEENKSQEQVWETENKIETAWVEDILSDLQIPVESEKSFSDSAEETFDSAVDATVETYNEVKDTVLETYEQSVEWLREYFKEFPDAGKIDLWNGEFLEVEYDSKNNKLYVDTQFFDGISDYKSEVELIDIENKSPDELRELISDKNAEFLAEYNNAIEKKETQKLHADMKEVLLWEKSRKTIDTLKINGEEMNVILLRDRKWDVKAKLSTPYWDSVSDSDLTIKIASIWDKISLQDIQDKIKNEDFESKYKELYKKNNPETKAA